MEKKQSLDNIKILFLGTPEFAATILDILIKKGKQEVIAAVTNPDKPGRRGKQIQIPAVKKKAQELDIPVYQPQNVNSTNFQGIVENLKPDIQLVAAFGQILSTPIINVPPLGTVNVHASLLPKYRGSAPIQHALLNREKVTGITIMQINPQTDTGPILMQKALAIDINDTSETLHNQLAYLGGTLSNKLIQRIKYSKISAIEQDPKLSSYAPKLTKKDGFINWNKKARDIHNQIRALHPSPGAYYHWKDTKLQIYPGQIGPPIAEEITPGTILGLQSNYLKITCRDREYLIPKLKPSSAKELTAWEFFNGYLKK